jgi:hypothetical protein
MTWVKEHEVIIDAADPYADRRVKFMNDVLTYHYETFLPAHGVTTSANSYQASTSSSYDYVAWDCRRTIVPTGRPNLASYEKKWMDALRVYTPSASTVSQASFTWDGTNDNPLGNGQTVNESYRRVFSGSGSTMPGFQVGEMRYKWFASDEDTNTWILFCNGNIIGMEIGDDSWWRDPGIDFITFGINLYRVGFYCYFPGAQDDYTVSIAGDLNPVHMGLPFLTNSYSPNENYSNFLLTDNIYYYVRLQGDRAGNPADMTNPYLIGKSVRTDVLLKYRNTTFMQVEAGSAAETIVYDSNYYIDTSPTSSRSMLLKTTTDEGIL